MKLGIVPDNPLERLALLGGVVPSPLVLASWGMGISRTLISATRLGVFEAVAGGERSADEVAVAIECDPIGTETLLNALCGFGYLRRRDGRYATTRVTDRWLLTDSKRTMRDAMLFFDDLWDQLDGLDETLRTGRSRDLHHGAMPDGFWQRYMRGLASMAAVAAKEVTRRLELPAGATRLLDVGGGHGLFAADLCRRHDGLTAEVLDLPAAAEHGEQIVDEAGMADRVRFRRGDLRTEDWGEGFDAVLIFNVLHNSTEAEAAAICRKAFDALRPGGLLAILDSEHREPRGNPSFMGGYNELFFFLLSGTRAYPEATMRGWMTGVGFTRLRSSRLWMMPEVLIRGWKPDDAAPRLAAPDPD